jgi:tRNA splicing ligase
MKTEITKYYCDCCKEEIESEKISKVGMKVNFRSKGGGCHEEIYETKDVCDNCMVEMGFNETEVEGYLLPKQRRTLSLNFKDIIKKIYG